MSLPKNTWQDTSVVTSPSGSQPILLYEKVEFNHLYDLATMKQDELALDLFNKYDVALRGKFASPYGLAQWMINFPKAVALSIYAHGGDHRRISGAE